MVPFPTEPQQLAHGVVRWDLPLVARGKDNNRCVLVVCECGAERRVVKSDVRRPKRNVTGWCLSCRRREHYRTLNNKRGPESKRFKGFRRLDRKSGYYHRAVYPGHWLYESMGNNGRRGFCRYILEHRYVMAEHVGRPLKPWEHVHHKDRDRANNDVSNLELLRGEIHAVVTAMEREIDRLQAENRRLKGE